MLIDDWDGFISKVWGWPAVYLVTEVSERVSFIGACPGESALVHLLAVDFLLDRPTGDEAVHHNILGLPNAACPVHALIVHAGIPGRVQDDHPVCCCEGQPQAPHLGCQQEYGDGRIALELLHPVLHVPSCTLSPTSRSAGLHLVHSKEWWEHQAVVPQIGMCDLQ